MYNQQVMRPSDFPDQAMSDSGSKWKRFIIPKICYAIVMKNEFGMVCANAMRKAHLRQRRECAPGRCRGAAPGAGMETQLISERRNHDSIE